MRSAPAAAVAVLGGARLTNESAYAWAKLAKGVIGTDHVDRQMGDGLPADVVLGLPRATIDEVCRPGGTVILLGPDVKEELPVLFLRLRHAVVNDGVKVVEVSPEATGFSPYATESLHPRPGEAGAAVRALLDGTAPGTDAGGVDAAALGRAAELIGAGPVTVVIGRQSLAESPDAVVDAAGALVARKPDTRFLSALRAAATCTERSTWASPPACSRGASRWARVVTIWPGTGRTCRPPRASMPAPRSAAAAAGQIEVLVLLGADPLGDFPDRDLAARAVAGARTVIALDQFATASVAAADVVFPVAGFTEVAGTSTNLEGRVSLLNQKVTAPGTARPDWIIAAELALRLGADLGLESVEAIAAEIAALAPAYAGVSTDRLAGPEARDGLVVPLAEIGSDADSPAPETADRGRGRHRST